MRWMEAVAKAAAAAARSWQHSGDRTCDSALVRVSIAYSCETRAAVAVWLCGAACGVTTMAKERIAA